VKVLVDTSAWIETLRKDGDAAVREAVRQATLDGRAMTSEIVLLELWNGALGAAERAVVRQLEETLERLPLVAVVWQAAYALARDCRMAGLTIPATDLLISACARHYGARLLHRDKHFDRVDRVVARKR
jgi:predicted nucleic acid-binding protein